jgi:flagellum-specific ATP synthase
LQQSPETPRSDDPYQKLAAALRGEKQASNP